jgi:hypothetical protein
VTDLSERYFEQVDWIGSVPVERPDELEASPFHDEEEVIRAEAEPRPAVESAAALARAVDGETFVFSESADVPAVWGIEERVLWPEGEPFLVVGPDGVGKTSHEAAMVATCLAALAGDRHQDAALTLRAVAERATSDDALAA